MALTTVRMLVVAALLLVAGLAVACGDDDDDGETATPAPTSSATPTATPSDGTPALTPPPATTEAEIEVREYVIAPQAARARPGTVIFKVTNTGEMTHQFLVVRSDLPIAQLPRKPLDAGVDEEQIEVVGRIDEIATGESGEVSVPVETGDYVLICNLYANGVSHYLSGMYRLFEVTPTAPDPQATPQPSATPAPSPSP
jgi:uncharacterized cupredoxin-like copper-binding protein